jgi:hypothetical protein
LSEVEFVVDPAETTDAHPRPAALLSVRLRREQRGNVIALEEVSSRDLTDAVAELWFEGDLRRGFAEVGLEEVRAQVRPVYREDAEAGRICAGFELETADPTGVRTRRFFPREYVEPVAARGARRLLENGTLQPGDLYYYELAPGDGAVSGDGSLDEPAAGKATLFGAPGRRTPGHLRVPLRRLLERAEAPTPYTADDPYPVFFTRSARERAERGSRKGADATPPVETGGLLIGPLCVCPDTGEMFAVIVDVLEAADSEATTHTLTYSSSTWARIQAIVRARQANPATRHHRILGQSHGHNFLPFDGAAACEECGHRAICKRSTAHLSEADRTWVRAVFNGEPWCVSQVFGLDARSGLAEAFYGQRGGSLVQRGYHVTDDFDEAVLSERGA